MNGGPLLSFVVSLQTTNGLATARSWSSELLGDASAAAFFLAPSRFVGAQRNDDSLSLTLHDAGLTGVLFGPNPPLEAQWSRCLVSFSAFDDHVGNLVKYDEWDFYTCPSTPLDGGSGVEVLDDDDAITQLLRAHAPDSAVWPGDDEIVHWFARRDDAGRLVSVAALVRWESGYHVVSSVATVSDARGRGHALGVVRGVLHAAHERGVPWVGLGVAHDNAVAQAVYVRAGFSLRSAFTNYGPPTPTH